jgi:hypothetical protein
MAMGKNGTYRVGVSKGFSLSVYRKTMASLTEFVSKNQPQGFSSRPYYSREGDSLSFYFRDEASYGERVDQLLTLYRSIETGNIVGCQIKGIQCILKRLDEFGIQTKEYKTLDLRIIFLGLGYGLGADETQREAVEQLRQAAQDSGAHLDADELIPA